MHTAIAELEQAQIRSDIPEFRPGDTLKVRYVNRLPKLDLFPITLIAKELQLAFPADSEHADDIRVLNEQAMRCRSTSPAVRSKS